MSQVLEQLELAVGPLGQDRRAEGLHDLLDGDGLVCQLVFGGAAAWLACSSSLRGFGGGSGYLPDKPKGAHAHRLQVRVSKSVSMAIFIFYLMLCCSRRTWW